jgi:hypothetical protein
MTRHRIDFQLGNELGEEEAKRRLIADIAYFAAERRGFSPGYELDDWLQAEQEVEASMEAPARAVVDTDAKTGTSITYRSATQLR